ncbi:hypothetical protein HPP92_003108 [Vanilla planifolia]|uniref:Uncharacterized protein n=1 Tax=Vanilla planifolia TaxID=51239 RepID=A0A835VNC0_VANPL|nr:hypothetical protein HPP92_003108 [Vanilla planifolia]
MCNCLLPESLRLPAVKQMEEYPVLSARMDRWTVTMEINASICHHNRQEIEDLGKASHPTWFNDSKSSICFISQQISFLSKFNLLDDFHSFVKVSLYFVYKSLFGSYFCVVALF